MNISGIRPIDDVNNYNSIKNSEFFGTSEIQKETLVTDGCVQETKEEQDALQQNAGRVFDYASQYDPDVEYELKGRESDLFSLDVEKAISDMKKDQVLQQYQFFVGESLGQGRVTSTGANADMLRVDENFDIPKEIE